MSRFLDELQAFIETQPFDVIRFAEMRRSGAIEVAERMKVSPCQDIYSGAKTFTMTAIGLLFDRGLLSPDEKICDIFRGSLPAGMDPRWELCTVDMALAHRPGLPGGFLDIDCSPSAAFTDDFLAYLFTFPLAYTPGEEERYSDGAYYLLSRVVSRKTGLPMEDFLWRELLWKLGFQEIAFSHCPRGYAVGATGVYVHAADLVKLGYLYLTGGLWKGERLLSQRWVDLVLERQYNFEWDDTHTVFYKGGMYGQKLIVAPAQGRVLAMQAFGANSDVVMKWMRAYRD